MEADFHPIDGYLQFSDQGTTPTRRAATDAPRSLSLERFLKSRRTADKPR
jgi:hypothetical protein